MILDYNLLFSDGQTPPTPLSADFNATNVIDTEYADHNLGAGTPLWVVCVLNDTQSGTTGETLGIILKHCATSGGTYINLLAGLTYSGGELKQGLHLMATPLPAKHKRYLSITYDGNVGLVWTGTVDAYLALNAPRT